MKFIFECSVILLMLIKTEAPSSEGRQDYISIESALVTDNHEDQCPGLWLVKDNGTCKCGSDLSGVVACDPYTKEVKILGCYCLTQDNFDVSALAGACILNCVNNTKVELYHMAPSDCTSLNRKGTLCGQCMDGHAAPGYSYDLKCIRCDSRQENWGLYITFAFLPLTVFIIIIIIFRINVLCPKIFVFVYAAQIIASPLFVKLVLHYLQQQHNHPLVKIPAKLLLSLYGVWNLDFMRNNVLPDVCINATPIQILVLDYLVAIYPMIMMAFAYIIVEIHGFGFKPIVYLWQPFHRLFARFRRQWGIKTTIMDAFVTFYFLSTTKLFSVSFSLLTVVALYRSDETMDSLRLFYDPSIEFFSREHLPYAVMAIIILMVFVFFPMCLLFCYQCRCFRKCLTKCKIQGETLDLFVDTFQMYYKDGSNGTRDCRWFAGFFLLIKLLGYLLYNIIADSGFMVMCSVLFVIGGMVVILIEPYKEDFNNIGTANLLFTAGLFLCSLLYQETAHIYDRAMMDYYVSSVVLAIVPLVYIIIVFIHHLMGGFRRNTAAEVENSLPHRLLHSDQYQHYSLSH